jgi:hypothetical protein
MSHKARERVAQYNSTVKSSQRSFEGVGKNAVAVSVMGSFAGAIAFLGLTLNNLLDKVN